MAVLRTAVIGVGYLGRFHAQKYHQLPNSQLVGVMDTHPDRRQAVAQELGVPAFADLDTLLPLVDAVSIAAPTTLHHQVGLKCLEAGKHVLMEKPIASNAVQAQELVSLAQAKGLVLQVGFLERFNPAFVKAAPMVANPQFIEALRISPFKERGHDVDVVLDLMIHDLDLVFALVDAPLKSLHAVGTSLMTQQTDLANVRLVFENGAVATLTASRISAKAERKFRVFQHHRYLSMDLGGPSLKVYSAMAQAGEPPPVQEESFALEKGDALKDEIQAFLQAVQGQSPTIASGETALHTLHVAERIIQDISHNRMP